MFKAIYLTQDEEKNVTASLSDVDEADLPDHNVAIDVSIQPSIIKMGSRSWASQVLCGIIP